MIVDTSVWIDYSADRETWQVDRLAWAIERRRAMIVDPVRLEVLAGLNAPALERHITAAFDGCEDVMQLHRIDAEAAARIYRQCHRAGQMIRSTTDCLIAAIAMRSNVPILHRDRDYDAIARDFPLDVVRQ